MSDDSRVAVLCDAPGKAAGPDQLDTLEQAETVAQTLRALGHTVSRVPFGLDLGRVRHDLAEAARVFNLVESVDGDCLLNHLAPAWLEHWGLAYTGCSALAHLLTTDKLLAKERMAAAGIPTPAWLSEAGHGPSIASERVIIKPVGEDASVDIDRASVLDHPGAATLKVLLAERRTRSRAAFAEAYVDGREFNLALVGPRNSPELLPPAEILFVGFAERGLDKVVDYTAKWRPGSYEYQNTVRSYVVSAADRGLVSELVRLAVNCWNEFGLSGYARVDFRVDPGGRPWVLEVNPNPCLSRDAGLASAAERNGWSYEELVRRILDASSCSR
jgi:D-alanine-D-alanine ligase